MKKSIDKLLLVNHVRHANAHNKIKEEQEMWKARETELAASSSAHMRKHSPLVRGRLVSDSMDSPDQSHSPTSSTYWSRQLMKVEENDPYRWGHSGYKEMYPEEFVGSSDNESSGPSSRRHKKQKRKRSLSSDTSSAKKSKKVKRKKHKHSSASHKSKYKYKKKKKM